jgi:hypothetical protein
MRHNRGIRKQRQEWPILVVARRAKNPPLFAPLQGMVQLGVCRENENFSARQYSHTLNNRLYSIV